MSSALLTHEVVVKGYLFTSILREILEMVETTYLLVSQK